MIGTTAALLGSAALGVGGNLLSGAIAAKGADKAADAQTLAALGSIDLQKQGLDFTKGQAALSRVDAMPWINAGKSALNQYRIELGQTSGKSKFREAPGYKFAVSEGEKGVINNLSHLGMKNSGAALKALTRFRTGLADQSFENYMTRLSGVAGTGQQQVADTSQIGANAANSVQQGYANMGGTMQDVGAARASGYVGSTNAWLGALNGGTSDIANTLGRFSYGA